jgi:pimeloyl-ACP methyl ester carboxylesterase
LRLSTQGSGPLVVKVAGLVSGVGLYHEAMAAAARAGFRVAALDTSGDRADDPAAWTLNWDRLSAEVIQALDRLEARRAVLWGTSFGCLLCLAVAARHPDRVSGLLLCSPPEPGQRRPLFQRLFRWGSRRPDSARTISLLFHAAFLPLNAWEFLVPAAAMRLPSLWRIAREASTPSSTILQKCRLLFEGPFAPLPTAGMPPSSIVVGGWDLVTACAGARRRARILPDCRLRVLPCAGHAAAYSRPRTYARWMVEELGRLCSES